MNAKMQVASILPTASDLVFLSKAWQQVNNGTATGSEPLSLNQC